MNIKNKLSEEDKALFREITSDTRQISQNTIFHKIQPSTVSYIIEKQMLSEQMENYYYFSDECTPMLTNKDSRSYLRADVDKQELKKLRRGDYNPEIMLDLHGLTQKQTKQELGVLITICRREYIFCASIMHGHGKHILKQQIPIWLSRHPLVMAFHQAPKIFGGDAAFLVLIELNNLK